VLTRIDHVMICVPDLAKGIETYTRLGFTVYPGGSHTGRPTHNAIAFHDEDYLEILSIRDRSAVVPGSPDASLALYLDQGGGFRIVALQSDDLAADVAAMRGAAWTWARCATGGGARSRARSCAGARRSSARGIPCRSSSSSI